MDPIYHWVAYSYNKDKECDFFEACFKRHVSFSVHDILDVACGSGGHMFELSRRGYRTVGFDISQEMAEFVNDKARKEGVPVKAFVSDMRSFKAEGIYDCAICATDTLRFLLDDGDIASHLKSVANSLRSGGLYILDFWLPESDGDLPDFEAEWEAQQGPLRVKTIYKQYPKTFDRKGMVFKDELRFEVCDNGKTAIMGDGPLPSRYLTQAHFNRLVKDEASFRVAEEICEGWKYIAILKKS